jgi:hypothetical protein
LAFAAAAAAALWSQDRVLQLETQLRQRDSEVEEALAAASAAGGRDKQVCVLTFFL